MTKKVLDCGCVEEDGEIVELCLMAKHLLEGVEHEDEIIPLPRRSPEEE